MSGAAKIAAACAAALPLLLVLAPLAAPAALYGAALQAAARIPEEAAALLRESFAGENPELAAGLEKIAAALGEKGLEEHIPTAQMIYLYAAPDGYEADEAFFERYAECFEEDPADGGLADRVSRAFGTAFSDETRAQIERAAGAERRG